MHSGFEIAAGLLLAASIVQGSRACDSALKPRPQSILRFYDSDSFGRLGVKGLGDNVHILDQYRCYDLTFLRNKHLFIYFNTAQQNDGTGPDTGPTYVGAVIVRTFSGKEFDRGPYSAYFYRNTSTKNRDASKWAHDVGVQASPESSSWAPANSFAILNDRYVSDEPVAAPSLVELDRQMQLTTSQAVKQLRQWHALVVTPESNGFRILHNSAQSDGRWKINFKASAINESYLIIRNYLVKYQASPNPTRDVFFDVGAQDADCVYIKLVAPGDALSTFTLQRSGDANDVITLKMNESATCPAPAD